MRLGILGAPGGVGGHPLEADARARGAVSAQDDLGNTDSSRTFLFGNVRPDLRAA